MKWVTVGKILHAHGIRGEIYLRVFSGDWFWLDGLIKSKDQNRFLLKNISMKVQKEFKFLGAREHKEGLLMRASEIQDRTEAERWRGFEFCIDEKLLDSHSGEILTLREILGFAVWDQNVRIGSVVGFSSNGPQDLLVIERPGGNKYEIPFVEAFLTQIDWDNKSLRMHLPEGLYE